MKTTIAYILGFTLTFTVISGGMYFVSQKYPWMFSVQHSDDNGGKLESTVKMPAVGPAPANADTTGGGSETISALKAMLAEKNDSLSVKEDSIQTLDSTVTQLSKNKSDDDSVIAQLQDQMSSSSNQRRKNMASAYEDMDPAAVAKIMSNLDDKDVIFILSNVQKKQAARIMGALDPARAAKLISGLGQSK